MQFGAFVPQGWRLDLVGVPAGYPQYEAMRDVALQLERLGYDGLWLYDHFHTVPDAKPEATFEMWTACTALAVATTRIRIGQMVGCNIYRPPALVAKVAACTDVVSNGRLDFGLGAGWYEHETIAYGYPFHRAGTRIEALEEALTIIRGMWTEDAFHHQGKHYHVGTGAAHTYRGEEVESPGAINHPKPIQRPYPPIWVGGGGEQKTLRVVAKHADWSNAGWSLEQVKHKNELLDRYCEELGRDPATLKRSMSVNCMFGDEERVKRQLHKMGISDSGEWMKSAMTGGAQGMIDHLAALRDHGRIAYVQIWFPDAVGGDSVQRFAEEVMPALR